VRTSLRSERHSSPCSWIDCAASDFPPLGQDADGVVPWAVAPTKSGFCCHSYAIMPLILPHLSERTLFIIACVVTALTLFVMGTMKVRQTRKEEGGLVPTGGEGMARRSLNADR
jgi:hypothetical protein